MITVEASIGKLAPKLQEQTLKDVPPLDADDRSALTFAAYVPPSSPHCPGWPVLVKPRAINLAKMKAPHGKATEPSSNKCQRTQE